MEGAFQDEGYHKLKKQKGSATQYVVDSKYAKEKHSGLER